MNEGKARYVPPPPEAEGNYRYYLIAGFRPVRILCDERGRMFHADAPEGDPPGTMIVRTMLVTTVEKDEDVEEIAKEQFLEYCRRARDPSFRLA